MAAQDIRGALGAAIARLEAEGVPSAPLAAELFLMHVLGRDRAFLYAHPEFALDADQAARFTQLVEQRAAGTPVQYLTGQQEFWGLEFEVNPSVLIPRPETEHVVEVALARLGARRADPLTVADVGTGSGCLAVALAHELPHAQYRRHRYFAGGSRSRAAQCGAAWRCRAHRILPGEFLAHLSGGLAPRQALLRFDREQSTLHRPGRGRELAAGSSRARTA